MIPSRTRTLALFVFVCSAWPVHAGPTVYLGGGLGDEKVIALTAAVAAADPHAVVLLDSPRVSRYTRHFLAALRPGRVVPVGSFPGGSAELEKRLGVRTRPILPWTRGRPVALWKALFPQAERVVVCPAEPRELLLHSACLAGVLKGPLFVTNNRPGEREDLRRRLSAWQTREVFVVGTAGLQCRGLSGIKTVRLADEHAVANLYRKQLLETGPVRTLVVGNPADARQGFSPMSALAPWIALQRRAVLLLTNDTGDNVPAVAQSALADRRLRDVENLLLIGDLRAIPMERRPNPIAGKDVFIEMEPLTPTGPDPFTFATGRLFNADPAVVTLVLARHRLLSGTTRHSPLPTHQALVVSNPGGSLPLMEMFSRHTALELRNHGYRTRTLFNDEVSREEMRRLLPEQDIFLWEGHHSTLVRDYEMPAWDEPMRPSLAFLQSCLALAEEKAQPLLQRGAVAVVGTSTRTYSGSGGAFALAFFNALLYENRSLGGSLRQAKNFLLAYSLLKEKRLGPEASMTGANLRAAWAFTLWGDPSLQLPAPTLPADVRPPVRHKVRGDRILVYLPDETHPRVSTLRYQAEMRPNGRLAGLVSRQWEADGQRMVPLVFAEVHLPKAPAGMMPRLRSRLPSTRYVFCWDGRRRCGYLLARPRSKDLHELRFQVEWEEATSIVSGP